MLNLDFICQHPAVVRDALRKRRDSRDVDEIVRLAEQRRALATRNDGLYASLKTLKAAQRTASSNQRTTLYKQIKAISEEIQQLELQSADIDAHLQTLLLSLPNLPHASVREGDGSTRGDEVRCWGMPPNFQFTPQAHWDLGTRLDIIDSESGAKIAGNHFVTLKGAGARLERALISFMLDVHTREHAYTEIMPPQLVKRSLMLESGQLPQFENQVYVIPEDELYLNPTAEVPLVGMQSNTVLAQAALPLRYVAWTTAFRRGTGSVSRHTKGLLRLHQFNKVELFQYVQPQDSYMVLEQMVQHAEHILQMLELTYRIVELDTAALPFTAAKTVDIDVWMPGIGDYIEISSASNCEAFQARRADIKYQSHDHTHAAYVHTLNASGLAVGRTMAAILETYQQADGSVIIPKVLRPYVGTAELSPPA